MKPIEFQRIRRLIKALKVKILQIRGYTQAIPAYGEIEVTDYEGNTIYDIDGLSAESYQLESYPPQPVTDFIDSETSEVVFSIYQSIGEPVSAISNVLSTDKDRALQNCLINF